MIETLTLGAAYLLGVPGWRVALLALLVWAPLAAFPLMVLVLLRAKKAHDPRPSDFCQGVASELRSGATLQHAVRAAAVSVGVRLSESSSGHEQTPGEMADALSVELGSIGRELRAILRAAPRSGARAADLFDEIGSYAIARAEMSHEVRIASAPARATAWFFLLAPVIYLWVEMRSGSLGGLLRAPQQRLPAVIGLTLFLVGLAAVVILMRRAAR